MTIILLFTFIYMFLDDNNFSGLNIIQELLKEELLKEKVNVEINNKIFEGMANLKSYNDNEYIKDEKKDEKKEIKKAVKKVSEQINNEEIKIEKIKPSLLQQFFNRLYFSVSTGCLLGYGDIYPITNIAKTLSIVQAIITVSLIIY